MHAYGNQGPFTVALLIGDSPIARGIALIEPQLLWLGDQALILRRYERLEDEQAPFTVMQEGGASLRRKEASSSRRGHVETELKQRC
jgi:hypothetical protein